VLAVMRSCGSRVNASSVAMPAAKRADSTCRPDRRSGRDARHQSRRRHTPPRANRPDHLAEGREIGDDIEALARSTEGDAKSGHD
jgi:hypothetical protein